MFNFISLILTIALSIHTTNIVAADSRAHMKIGAIINACDAAGINELRIVGQGQGIKVPSFPVNLGTLLSLFDSEPSLPNTLLTTDMTSCAHEPLKFDVSNTTLYALLQTNDFLDAGYFVHGLTYVQKQNIVAEADKLGFDKLARLIRAHSVEHTPHLTFFSSDLATGKITCERIEPSNKRVLNNPYIKKMIQHIVENVSDNGFDLKQPGDGFIDLGVSTDAFRFLALPPPSDVVDIDAELSLDNLKRFIFDLDQLQILTVHDDIMHINDGEVMLHPHRNDEYFYLLGIAYLYGYGVRKNNDEAARQFSLSLPLFDAAPTTLREDYLQRARVVRSLSFYELTKLLADDKEKMDFAQKSYDAFLSAKNLPMDTNLSTDNLDWQKETSFELNNPSSGERFYLDVLCREAMNHTRNNVFRINGKQVKQLLKMPVNSKAPVPTMIHTRIKTISDEKIVFHHARDKDLFVDVHPWIFQFILKIISGNISDSEIDETIGHALSLMGETIVLDYFARLGMLQVENETFYFSVKSPAIKIKINVSSTADNSLDALAHAYTYGCGVKKGPHFVYRHNLKKIKSSGDKAALSQIKMIFHLGQITRPMMIVAINEYYRIRYRTPLTMTFDEEPLSFAKRAFDAFFARWKKRKDNLTVDDFGLLAFARYYDSKAAHDWVTENIISKNKGADRKQREQHRKTANKFETLFKQADIANDEGAVNIFMREIKEFAVEKVFAEWQSTQPINFDLKAKRDCRNVAGHFGDGIGFYFNPDLAASQTAFANVVPAPPVPAVMSLTAYEIKRSKEIGEILSVADEAAADKQAPKEPRGLVGKAKQLRKNLQSLVSDKEKDEGKQKKPKGRLKDRKAIADIEKAQKTSQSSKERGLVVLHAAPEPRFHIKDFAFAPHYLKTLEKFEKFASVVGQLFSRTQKALTDRTVWLMLEDGSVVDTVLTQLRFGDLRVLVADHGQTRYFLAATDKSKQPRTINEVCSRLHDFQSK